MHPYLTASSGTFATVFKVNGYTFRGSNSASFSFALKEFAPILSGCQLLKEKNLLP